jgi:hypothetical protein
MSRWGDHQCISATRATGYGLRLGLGDVVGAAAVELGDGEAAVLGPAERLAAGDGVGLADISGLGEAETSVVPAVGVDCLLRLRPMGTTTIPSAVTIRKLTAPHSRRKNSRFKPLDRVPAQSTSVVV